VLVRVDPEESKKLVKTSQAEHVVMRGREMSGWLRVGPEHVATNRQLEKWMKVGAGYAGSLPDKKEAKR